jgi:hypothetical protein
VLAATVSDWLATAGETVGGGAALGAGVAWAGAAIVGTFRTVDVGQWVLHGGGYGGLFGLTALILHIAGVGWA